MKGRPLHDIVMPDANTRGKEDCEWHKGDWRYEDFFFEEFMPFHRKGLQDQGRKKVSCHSRSFNGGEGTFIYAFIILSCSQQQCPLSAATGRPPVDEMKNYMLWQGTGMFPIRKKAYFENTASSALSIKKDDQKKAVRWYIDCGDDDTSV
jgi:hypothetical protein